MPGIERDSFAFCFAKQRIDQSAAGSLDIAVRVPSSPKTKSGIHKCVSRILVRQKGLEPPTY